jgi:predicted ABC-type ATPase
MQELIIIAGPNGSGKTSFANAYLPAEANRLVFVNADEIARELASANLSASQLDLRAGRLMLERIQSLTLARTELLFETTLASLAYARQIPKWQVLGYTVALIYLLRLPDVESALSRVRRRVAAGGHDIPPDVVARRFGRSLEYLEKYYKPVVDEWYVYNSLEGSFELAEAWNEP